MSPPATLPMNVTPPGTTPTPTSTPQDTTWMIDDICKINKKKKCLVCSGAHFTNQCKHVKTLGYECTFTNPNPHPSTTPELQEQANAACTMALCTMQEQQMTPQQLTPMPPPDSTQSEGKSCVVQLSDTEKQQQLDCASPTQKCTHTHASQTLLTQIDCSKIVENDSSGNSLNTTVVPSCELASVSEIDSCNNTCNAMQQHHDESS